MCKVAWISIALDDKFLRLEKKNSYVQVFGESGKQISNMCGWCNIEMCRLHLDEIMYRACYPSDIFYSFLKDIAFFYNMKICDFS